MSDRDKMLADEQRIREHATKRRSIRTELKCGHVIFTAIEQAVGWCPWCDRDQTPVVRQDIRISEKQQKMGHWDETTSFPAKDIAYLRGRVAQVFDAPNSLRPRWTVADAHAVCAVLVAIGGSADGNEEGERRAKSTDSPWETPALEEIGKTKPRPKEGGQ